MAARPRYKSLFQAERARAQRIKGERDALIFELRRIRGVLAHYAKTELVPDLDQAVELTPEGQPIELYAIGMEGLKAYLHVNTRHIVDDVPIEGHVDYEWKGRRLICRQ